MAKLRLRVTLLTLMPLLFPATAAATPADGVTATVLSQAARDGHDYILREITIAPGGSTGWHWHQGRVYGVIKAGTLTHDAANCTLDGVYNAGDPITEPPGPDHVHIGRNLGNTPLVMWVLYIDPAGSPFADDAPDPGCG
jgi:quercetin dioxygenase-like cupin family protein